MAFKYLVMDFISFERGKPMQEVNKSYSFALAFVTTLALAVIAVFTFGSVTTAQAAVLGSESPSVYCTYSQNGEEVDGNNLTAGTYDVSFNISGVEAVSVIQVTATYDETVTVASTPVAVMSDTTGYAVSSMGEVLSNGNIVFGFVSNNSDSSAINADGTLIATVTMTFAQDGDAAKHITVADNPNLTFVQVSYADGFNNSYAINSKDPDYTQGTLYPMTCDVTPTRGYAVSGSLVIMTNTSGRTDNVPVYGEYTIDVYKDAEMTDLYTSVKSVQTDNSNSFTIEALPIGTYYASISGKYAITRADIVITVTDSDISGAVIPIVNCDFDENGYVTAADTGLVYMNSFGSDGDKRCDLDGNGFVTAADTGVVYSCSFGEINYSGFSIN